MAAQIPDLWSNDIKVDVLSPLAILKTQSELLGTKTKGLLLARVRSVTLKTKDDGTHESHKFELFAPAINYSEKVLTVQHKEGRVYPAWIIMPDAISWPSQPSGHNEDLSHRTPSFGLAPASTPGVLSRPLDSSGLFINTRGLLSTTFGSPLAEYSSAKVKTFSADNERAFILALGVALKSTPVRSAIDSILAMSNERNTPPAAPAA